MQNNILTESWIKLPWQMSFSERQALISILSKLQPKLSLEIGTYKGGSLQAFSKFSKEVISVDIDPGVAKLSSQFPNTRFVTGDSAITLAALVTEFNTSGRFPEVILVDGDHSEAGVRKDLNLLLTLRPTSPVIILMHDSFNPGCRRGIISADWIGNPHVRSLEVDLVTGVYHRKAKDTAQANSMWGGLAMAILDAPNPNPTQKIIQTSKDLFDIVFAEHKRVNRSLASIVRKLICR